MQRETFVRSVTLLVTVAGVAVLLMALAAKLEGARATGLARRHPGIAARIAVLEAIQRGCLEEPRGCARAASPRAGGARAAEGTATRMVTPPVAQGAAGRRPPVRPARSNAHEQGVKAAHASSSPTAADAVDGGCSSAGNGGADDDATLLGAALLLLLHLASGAPPASRTM